MMTSHYGERDTLYMFFLTKELMQYDVTTFKKEGKVLVE